MQVFCLFNYSPEQQLLTYYVFDAVREQTTQLLNLLDDSQITIGKDYEHLIFKPYQFYVLQAKL